MNGRVLLAALVAVGCQACQRQRELPKLVLAPLPAFASLDAYCAGKVACGRDVLEDEHGEGERELPRLGPAWPAGWSGATWLGVRSAPSAEPRCALAFTAGTQTYVLEDIAGEDCGVESHRFQVAMHDGWLAVITGDRGRDRLWLCGKQPPACTPAQTLGDATSRIDWSVRGKVLSLSGLGSFELQ